MSTLFRLVAVEEGVPIIENGVFLLLSTEELVDGVVDLVDVVDLVERPPPKTNDGLDRRAVLFVVTLLSLMPRFDEAAVVVL